MEKRKKVCITVTTVILILVILLIVFRPGLIKRLTGEVSSVNTNDETEVISNEFINEVCNISVDNENFMTIDGTIIMDEGKDGVATVNIKSDNLVFTKEIEVNDNDFTRFSFPVPRDEYIITITKDGYQTYENSLNQSSSLMIILSSLNKDTILSSNRVWYNTYYDYYNDGTIRLKAVGSPPEYDSSDNFEQMVIYKIGLDYLNKKGIMVDFSSGLSGWQGELAKGLNSLGFASLVSNSNIIGYNRESLSTEYNRINNGECTLNNLEDNDNCIITKFTYDILINKSMSNIQKFFTVMLTLPVPTRLEIDSKVSYMPSLAFISSDEINLDSNIIKISELSLYASKIGTLNINTKAFEAGFSAQQSYINNLNIGNNITVIPQEAFKDSQIDNINLPDTLKIIEEDAFRSVQTSAITIPNSVTTIGDYAFSECGLKEIKLSEKLENIGRQAFSSNNITEINLSSSLKNIGTEAFSYNDLVDVYWDTNANVSPFFANRAENVKLTIGPNVSVVNNNFNGLKLTELNLSYGIKEIQNEAFGSRYGNSNFKLKSVTIPNSVEKIGDYAFRENELTSITIPNSVMYLGSNAFSNNNLDTIYFNAVNIKTMGQYVFSGNKSSGCTLIMSEGIKSIPDYAFSGAKIVDLTIPSSVTSIGKYAFSNNLLTELPSLPSSIKNIGNGWFMSNKLTNVVIPHGIESIDSYAFVSNGITNVLIPNTVKKIGYQAFYNNKIKSIVIPESVETIESYAFYNNSFSEITIMGDQTRFNSNWTNIGFPASLKPSN